jgi:hypothetical protein
MDGRRYCGFCSTPPPTLASRPRLLAEIARNHGSRFWTKLLYRVAIIPATKSALLAQRARYAWMNDRPAGARPDPLSPIKFLLTQTGDATIGNSDMMPVWNLKAHAAYPYPWDGLNTDLTEVMRASALASGATPGWLDQDSCVEQHRRQEDVSLRRPELHERRAVPENIR